jgi:hypothetical protein
MARPVEDGQRRHGFIRIVLAIGLFAAGGAALGVLAAHVLH